MKKKSLLAVLLLALMLLSANVVFAASVKNVTVTPKAANPDWFSSTIDEDGDHIVFSFVIPADGKVDISMQGLRNETYFSLYNDDKEFTYQTKKISKGTTVVPGTASMEQYLLAGTYHLICGDNGANFFGGAGSVRVKVTYTNGSTNEVKPNNSAAEAQTLAQNQTVRGMISDKKDNERDDYYKISFPGNGDLHLQMTAYFNGPSLHLYNEQLEQLKYFRAESGNLNTPKVATADYELAAGTYYIRITDYWANSDPSGFYEISWSRICKHETVTDAAVAATCTKTGLTEGSHCSKCGEVFTKQNVVAALGHTWSEWTTTKAATTSAPGVSSRTCSVCKETETQSIPQLETEKKTETEKQS